MALSINNRGSGTHNTSATSFTLSPASNPAAISTLALCIAADNSSSGGSTNNITSVTDSLGNTWTLAPSTNVVFDPGAANTGVQGSIYTTKQDVAAVTTGTVITVNFGLATLAKAWTLTEIAVAAGKVANVRTSGAKAAGATGTAATSGATGTVNIGEVTLAAIFAEFGTTQTCTGDGDTTNGSWSTLQYNEIGSTNAGMCIASQAKLQTTANSTQTYDVTFGLSTDYHSSWVVFQEVDGAQSSTPAAAAAASGATNPTVTLGGVSSTPAAGAAAAGAVNPSLTIGAVDRVPAPAIATSAAVDVAAAGENRTPDPAVAPAAAANPTATLGAVSRTPAEAVAPSSATSPIATLGGVSRTPAAAVATGAGATPSATLGGVSRLPATAAAPATAVDPGISQGLTRTPDPAVAASSAATPQASPGPVSSTPAPAVASSSAATLATSAPPPGWIGEVTRVEVSGARGRGVVVDTVKSRSISVAPHRSFTARIS